ncbi:MAG: hypothetical protein D6B27_08670 [Gammaproteobacteria bacterium]|nr:MAG: hypothetical protein D6B27_08670 [Gammaproteobacteria bacterium]
MEDDIYRPPQSNYIKPTDSENSFENTIYAKTIWFIYSTALIISLLYFITACVTLTASDGCYDNVLSFAGCKMGKYDTSGFITMGFWSLFLIIFYGSVLYVLLKYIGIFIYVSIKNITSK